MQSTLASLGSGFRGFFSWWGSELSELLPSWILGNGGPVAPLIVSVEDAGLRFIDTRNGKAADETQPQEIMPTQEVLDRLGELRRSKRVTSVGLRLPYRAVFVRRVELPAAASSNFGRLLAFDLDRATPFKAKDVFTSYYIERTPASPGKVWVCHLVVKRSAIETLKSRIEEMGAAVAAIDCWNEDGSAPLPVNFLEGDADPAPTARRRSIMIQALGTAAALLIVSATYFVFERRQTALQELDAQTARLKVRAQEVRETLARSQNAFSEIANLKRLRAETVSKVYVIEELTRLLPDTAYVTDLKMEGSTVDISGLATGAASLLATLERSTLFFNATSTAPLTFDQQQDKERFSIRAHIRGATSSDHAKLEGPEQ